MHVKSFVNVLKTITAHCVNERAGRKEKLHIHRINDYYSHSNNGNAMTLPDGSDVSSTHLL
jgi:hypothetical protein